MYYETDLIIHDLDLNIDEIEQLENIIAESEPETDLTDFPEWIKTILCDDDLLF